MKKTTLILTITATIIFSSSSIVSGASTQDTMDLYNSVAPISGEKSCRTKFFESFKTMPSEFGVRRDITNDCEAAPFTVLLNHLMYGIIKSPDTGRYWLDRNLGATEVCADADGDGIAGLGDEACFGHMYQWGRKNDGHEDRTSASVAGTLASSITNAGTTSFILYDHSSDWASTDSGGALRAAAWKDGGSNDICPVGFSVPTDAELKADTIHDATYTGTNDITNTTTAFSSFLKFPVVGFRTNLFGANIVRGNRLYTWSRTGPSLAVGSSAGISSNDRSDGLSVRCIMDK